jgi:hypothetical protein
VSDKHAKECERRKSVRVEEAGEKWEVVTRNQIPCVQHSSQQIRVLRNTAWKFFVITCHI